MHNKTQNTISQARNLFKKHTTWYILVVRLVGAGLRLKRTQSVSPSSGKITCGRLKCPKGCGLLDNRILTKLLLICWYKGRGWTFYSYLHHMTDYFLHSKGIKELNWKALKKSLPTLIKSRLAEKSLPGLKKINSTSYFELSSRPKWTAEWPAGVFMMVDNWQVGFCLHFLMWNSIFNKTLAYI